MHYLFQSCRLVVNIGFGVAYHSDILLFFFFLNNLCNPVLQSRGVLQRISDVFKNTNNNIKERKK